jgi:predicted metalloprotease
VQLGDADQDRSNVEDRRGLSGRGIKLGLGGTIALLVLSFVFKTDLFSVINPGSTATTDQVAPARDPETTQRGAAERELERVAVGSFNDVQRVWARLLRDSGNQYRDAKLVLFWDEIQSGCGAAAAEMGPFYCPVDERVYIDLGFYRELSGRFGAPGDFAQAYVIAHEVGHHVQNLLGITERAQTAQRRDPAARNAVSVRVELQADCLAGVWGHSATERNLLDPGDVEEGLRAAAAVGDDRIQRTAGRRISPESFTHGSASDRARWFRRGLDTGSADACDTFTAASRTGRAY